VAGLVTRLETRPEGIYALQEPELARDLLRRFEGSFSPEDAARFRLEGPTPAAPASPVAAPHVAVAG
jgi:hypothetical protein